MSSGDTLGVDVFPGDGDVPEFHALLREMGDAGDVDHQAWLVMEFLRRTDAINRAVSSGICYQMRADRTIWYDEYSAIVVETSWKMLVEVVAKPELAGKIRSWRGVLRSRSLNEIVKFRDRNAGANEFYTSGLQRRRARRLLATQSEMLLENRDVTLDEVVAETNRRIAANSAGEERRGALCTVEDFALGMNTVAPEKRVLSQGNFAVVESAESEAFEQISTKELVAECVDACEAVSPRLGIAARHYLAGLLGYDTEWAQQPNAAQLARRLGVSPTTGSRILKQLKAVLGDHLAERPEP